MSLSNFGKKIIIPTTTDMIAATKTAPAAISLVLPASKFFEVKPNQPVFLWRYWISQPWKPARYLKYMPATQQGYLKHETHQYHKNSNNCMYFIFVSEEKTDLIPLAANTNLLEIFHRWILNMNTQKYKK